MDMSWLPDSGLFRNLITECKYEKLSKGSPNRKLIKSKVKFTPNELQKAYPFMGKVKVILKNMNGPRIKLMVYVVRGGKESLLGRSDGEALGII